MPGLVAQRVGALSSLAARPDLNLSCALGALALLAAAGAPASPQRPKKPPQPPSPAPARR